MWVVIGVTALVAALARRRSHVPVGVPLFLAVFTASSAQTLVIPALPAFQRALRVSPSSATWVLTAFMAAAAIATPIAGRLGDLRGHRPVLAGCLLATVAGAAITAVGAAAASAPLVVTGRAVQGIGCGAFPVAVGLARGLLTAAQLTRTVAIVSAMFGLGGAVGMVIAGPLTALGGLGAPSLVTLGLALTSLTLLVALPTAPVEAPGAPSDGDIAAGSGRAALLAVLLRPATVGLTVITVLLAATLFGGITLVPRLAQADTATGHGFGLSPAATGLLLLPVAVTILGSTLLTARMVARRGGLVGLRAGSALAVVASLALAAGREDLWSFTGASVLVGAAYGLIFASLGVRVIEIVEPVATGTATALNTLARTAGGAAGAQLAVAVVTMGSDDTAGYGRAFVLLAVVAGLAAAGTLVPLRAPRRVAAGSTTDG